MIKTQNQTNPKYSFGKSKRVLAGIVDEDINISKSAHIKNSKSNNIYDTTGILKRNLGYDHLGNPLTDYFYTSTPTNIYKYNKSPKWGFSKSERQSLNKDRERYAYYDLPYNPLNDSEKIKRNWNNRIIGGDIGCDSKFKEYIDSFTLPGPGKYNPNYNYYKYYNNNSSGYMRPKGNFGLERKSGCNNNVSPWSYEIGEKSNLIKFNNSPKFKFGNGNRSENKNTNLSLGDRYLIYSSFGEQIMTQKDSRPQFTFGKENRFGK